MQLQPKDINQTKSKKPDLENEIPAPIHDFGAPIRYPEQGPKLNQELP